MPIMFRFASHERRIIHEIVMTLRICIVQPTEPSDSETFVEDQRRYLGERFDCRLLHGGYFPERYESGRLLVADDGWRRFWNPMLRRVFDVSWDAARRKAMRRYLGAERIDLVFTQYGPTGAEVADVCRRAGVPFVVHFHGFDAYRMDTLSRYSSAYEQMFTHGVAFVAVSRDMCEQLVSLGAPREKIRYNSCGAETNLFQGSAPLSAPPTFLAVGRFVEKKAPHLTLLAFKEVAARCSQARLIMVGDGPLLDACSQMVIAAGLEDRVDLPGVKRREEVASLMRKARAFVQHSVRSPDGDREGTPVAVLEAGASGLPVVATRHAGIKDAVLDGETGFLVDEHDVKAMSDAMVTLAEDPEKAEELGTNARKRIVSEFGQERQLLRLAQILEEAAAGGTEHAGDAQVHDH